MTEKISRADQKRSQIVAAGQALFLRNGFRGTTMEAIAREAGVAKPTLYGYFPDKEAVFVGVMAQLVEQMRGKVIEQLQRDGEVAGRITAALIAKTRVVRDLLAESPHADELYGQKWAGAEEGIAGFETWLEGEIAKALEADGRPKPDYLAWLIFACAEGIAKKTRKSEEYAPAIEFMVGRLLG